MKNSDILIDNPLWVVDVGARGGMHPRWLGFMPFYKGVLFEPDPTEYELLKNSSGKNLTVLNSALSDSATTLDLHLCRSPGTSSVFKPNIAFLNQFPDSERFDVIEKIRVKTDTLDNQLKKANISEIDFIKIDTQGYELAILKGSVDYLDNIIGLEVEVEFVPMYEKQPLFGEVDSFAREHGFELFDIRRYFWKRKKNKSTGSQKGQLIFGDALYFKSPEQILLMAEITQKKIIRSICIYLAYGYLDLAQTLFMGANRKGLLEKQTHDEVALFLKKHEKRFALPDFRGKTRIQSLIERIGNTFSFSGWYSGTDKSLGNVL